MSRSRRTLPVLAGPVLAAALGLAACTAGSLPYPPVPPLQSEARPRPPLSSVVLVWRPGDWQWTGNGYAWQPGAYEPAAGHSSTWVPGHWEGAGGQYAWVPGRWL